MVLFARKEPPVPAEANEAAALLRAGEARQRGKRRLRTGSPRAPGRQERASSSSVSSSSSFFSSAAAGGGRAMKGPAVATVPAPAPASEVIREGELEKRSDSLFQLWKKKLVVLSKDSLSLFSPEAGKGGGKELPFGSIQKVDCVERTGKYVYFTIVTTDRKEIDFRCPGESCWNASITLALIDWQNKRAIQDFKSRQEAAAAQQGPANGSGPRDRRLARAP